MAMLRRVGVLKAPMELSWLSTANRPRFDTAGSARTVLSTSAPSVLAFMKALAKGGTLSWMSLIPMAAAGFMGKLDGAHGLLCGHHDGLRR